ncbi:MAG: hypothetical protein ACPGNV_12760 [Mangrovicoccus sp.]
MADLPHTPLPRVEFDLTAPSARTLVLAALGLCGGLWAIALLAISL